MVNMIEMTSIIGVGIYPFEVFFFALFMPRIYLV